MAFDLDEQAPTADHQPSPVDISAEEFERLRAENQALQAENERLKQERENAEALTLQRRVVIWVLRCVVTFLIAIVLEELLHELFSAEILKSLEEKSFGFIAAIVAVNPLTVGYSFLTSIVHELFDLHHINPFVLVMNGGIAALGTAYKEGPLAAILVGIALFVGFSYAYRASNESFAGTLIFGPFIAFAMLFVLLVMMFFLWLLFLGGIKALGAIAVLAGSLPVLWHYVLLTVYKRTSMDFEDRIADGLIRLL